MDSQNEAPKLPIHQAFKEISKVKVSEEQERVRLIEGGALLSVAAQFCPGDQTHVRVTFESRDGYHDAVMPTAVYDRRIDNPLCLSSLAFYEGIHGAPITTTLIESKRVA